MKLTAKIIGHVLEFIKNRHAGNVEVAGNHQMWLKGKLRKKYTTVLLKHGDPDGEGYLEVMEKWIREEQEAVQRQGA